MSRYVGRLALALVIALAAYLVVYRPLQLRWGATRQEVARAMPGDDIQPRPIFNATRAITIDATPEQAWPWLVQIGYKRAGWYGYDWVDNAGIASAKRIMPEWQHIQVGDTVPIWEGINFRVAAFEPNRYVVWQSPSGRDSMSLGLYPRRRNAHALGLARSQCTLPLDVGLHCCPTLRRLGRRHRRSREPTWH
jgi:hypothetical protein